MKNTTQNIINVSLAIIVTLLIFNVFELKEQVGELDENLLKYKAAYNNIWNLEGWKKLHSDDLKFTGNIKTSGVHIGKDAGDVFNVIKF